jgi:hypothetical protein
MKYFLCILLLLPTLLYSQPRYTVSGRVSDFLSGEDLIGSTVVALPSYKGVATNSYGFYSLSLPEGKYTLRYGFIGYSDLDTVITINRNITIDIELRQQSISLEEVIISSTRPDRNISSAEMGVEKLNIKQIELIPVLFGEKDILKTIQLLPGVSTPSEGSTGFNVRGGSADQNLILLDEASVYSSSHLLGFFSIFNSDAIKDVTIYKGGIPAKFGGRASSVLDITMNNGNMKELSLKGGIGLLSTRITLEAPIVKEKVSFIVSGRRSYADVILKALPGDIIDNQAKLYFYDLNTKINYKIGEKDRLFLSGYFGRDSFGFGESGMDWGNATGTIRWNHLFGDRLFSNLSIIYSDYSYGFNFERDIIYNSGIKDLGIKEDLIFYPNPSNTFMIGGSLSYRKFNPGELTWSGSNEFEIVLDNKSAVESALYFSGESDIGSRISAIYGIRVSSFNRPDLDHKSFLSPEPRVSLNIKTWPGSSFKIAYNRITQYLHLLSNSTSGQATDIWIPSSDILKPVYASQVSTGIFQNLFDNQIETSVEGYYKLLNNITDYEDGTSILLNEDIESHILSGRGRSYGVEFYIKRSAGKLTGWISYTLSRTEREIENINGGDWYPARYDKTHDFSMVASYRTGDRLSLSASWVYATGNAVTFPGGKYIIDKMIIPWYTERNGYRMPSYHRLDLNLHLDGKEREGKYKSSWDFSVYNLYNRKNAYSINFRESESVSGATEAVKISLFGIVPAITWNFNF